MKTDFIPWSLHIPQISAQSEETDLKKSGFVVKTRFKLNLWFRVCDGVELVWVLSNRSLFEEKYASQVLACRSSSEEDLIFIHFKVSTHFSFSTFKTKKSSSSSSTSSLGFPDNWYPLNFLTASYWVQSSAVILSSYRQLNSLAAFQNIFLHPFTVSPLSVTSLSSPLLILGPIVLQSKPRFPLQTSCLKYGRVLLSPFLDKDYYD